MPFALQLHIDGGYEPATGHAAIGIVVTAWRNDGHGWHPLVVGKVAKFFRQQMRSSFHTEVTALSEAVKLIETTLNA